MKNIESISIKQLETKQLANNSLKSDILLSANIKFDESMFKHPSRLDAFAAIFCVSGEAEVQINLKKYNLTSGTIALHVPENIIQIKSNDNLIIYPFIISSDYIKKNRVVSSLFQNIKTIPLHSSDGNITYYAVIGDIFPV